MVRPTLSAVKPVTNQPISPSVLKEQNKTHSCTPLEKYNTEPKYFQVGATGSLYVGKEIHTGISVAIKVIPLKDKNYHQAFDNEVRILSSIKNSEFIVSLKDHFTHRGRGYIVMELLSQDLFTRSETFETVEEVRHIFQQICQGVAELHQNRIAHLDLKPENVLVDEYDSIKICDFGSSFQWANDSRCYKHVGSDYYLAPEIFAHHRGYDAEKADIWSLGIMLHFMLTNNFPFDGNSEKEILGNYFMSNISLKELEVVCPDDVSCHALLSSMLHKNPEMRPSIMDVLQHEWFLNHIEELSFK